MKNIRIQLKKQFDLTLQNNEAIRRVLECTAARLGLKLNDFLEGLLYYDANFGEYDNTVYADFRVRGALYLKYFVEGSYHIRRQQLLTQFVRECRGVKNFVDIGYGAPGLYIEDVILQDPSLTLTLLDKFEAARKFSDAFFTCVVGDKTWEKQVILREFDLDSITSPGKFDVYILFDSIEHAKDPTASFQMIVDNAPRGAKFILSLPIEPANESGSSEEELVHFIEWLTEEEALGWLKDAGLVVKKFEIVRPTKVDVWAEGLSFYNIVVLCERS